MHAHVYLWRHALETSERIQPAVAPEYALKLRTASAICRASVVQHCMSMNLLKKLYIWPRARLQPAVALEYAVGLRTACRVHADLAEPRFPSQIPKTACSNCRVQDRPCIDM